MTEKSATPEDICDGTMPGCNGGDDFKTVPCPIHSKPEIHESEKFGETITTITDDFISPQRIGQWEGFIFKCPNCNLYSVMVNEHTAPENIAICANPKCGKRAFIKSYIVTDYVTKLTARRTAGIKS